MRLTPHVSSQAPRRPARSALRFSRASRPQIRSCSALTLVAAQRPEVAPMPFVRKGTAALTERLDVRVAPAEKVRLRDLAAAAGVPVAELVRARALGRPVVARTDDKAIRELKRLGGLLKKVHIDSGGAYSTQTAAALADLRAAIARLAVGDRGIP